MSNVERIILRILPIIAPVPTLYLVYQGLTGNGWNPVAALITAAALEILGYFAVTLVGGMNEHNRTLSAVEKTLEVSARRAYFPSLAYAGIALLLTVFTKMFPALYIWSLAVFPFVGLLGAWTQAEWRVLENHTDAKIKSRADAKAQREQAKQEKTALRNSAPAIAQLVAKAPRKAAQVAPVKISKAIFVGYLRDNPGATNMQVAQHFGVSHQAVSARRKTVTPAELGLTK